MTNKLPKLPQVKKKREAHFAERVLDQWLSEQQPFSMAIETKQTTTNSIRKAEVTEEQLNYLLRVRSTRGVKIRTQSINGQPDYIWCRNMPSYICVKFPKCVCFISPEAWQMEKKPLITSERAKQISTMSI